VLSGRIFDTAVQPVCLRNGLNATVNVSLGHAEPNNFTAGSDGGTGTEIGHHNVLG